MAVRLILCLIFLIELNRQAEARCRFPGIPVPGTATWNDTSIHLERNGAEFQENDVVFFKCPRGRQIASYQSAAIICQNGDWNASLPRCDRVSSWKEWPMKRFNFVRLQPKWESINSRAPLKDYNSSRFELSVNESISEVIFEQIKGRRILDTFEESCATCPGNVTKIITIVADSLPNVTVAVGDAMCQQLSSNSRNVVRVRCENENLEKYTQIVNISLSINSTMNSLTLLIKDGTHCGIPPVPLDGFIDNFDDFDHLSSSSVIIYNCSENFELVGDSMATCNVSTGLWGPIPVCRKEILPTTWSDEPTYTTTETALRSTTIRSNVMPTRASDGKRNRTAELHDTKSQAVDAGLILGPIFGGVAILGLAAMIYKIMNVRNGRYPVDKKSREMDQEAKRFDAMELQTHLPETAEAAEVYHNFIHFKSPEASVDSVDSVPAACEDVDPSSD